MAQSKGTNDGMPIIIGIISALLTSQIVKGYNISLLTSTLITAVIAVIFWYGFRFFSKRVKNKRD